MRGLVAIPVFNEEQFLARVVARVRDLHPEVLIIDDGSTDGTPAILSSMHGLPVIRHAENRGYGQSLIDAFRFASTHGYDWIITMDCDDQHEPGHIPEFIEEVCRGRADVVSGSRYLAEFQGNDVPPLERRRINSIIARILSEILGLRLTDAFCGFKALRVAAVSGLSLDVSGYAFPLQFWVQAARGGLVIEELPIRLIYNDPNRHFGGALDDPDVRLRHYLNVLDRELVRVGWGDRHPVRDVTSRLCGAC